MQDHWKNMWDARYRQAEFAYGVNPNEYFKEHLLHLKPGKILLGAEGEGRNAVYAAKLGWKVSAFDISIEGKNKALQLAKQQNVHIDYRVGSLPDLGFETAQFDAIGLIYAHFPPHLWDAYFPILNKALKQGGRVIFEAFGKGHLPYREKNNQVGGPGAIEMLFAIEDVQQHFPNYQVLELLEQEVELSEGLGHKGVGSVTRFLGVKKE